MLEIQKEAKDCPCPQGAYNQMAEYVEFLALVVSIVLNHFPSKMIAGLGPHMAPGTMGGRE